jgi:hypothetical protein
MGGKALDDMKAPIGQFLAAQNKHRRAMPW